jgi:hypothetical protein
MRNGPWTVGIAFHCSPRAPSALPIAVRIYGQADMRKWLVKLRADFDFVRRTGVLVATALAWHAESRQGDAAWVLEYETAAEQANQHLEVPRFFDPVAGWLCDTVSESLRFPMTLGITDWV